MTMISVIIPVLNEAIALPQTLASTQATTPIEVIVVDGGSQDASRDIAVTFGAKVMVTPPGRAMQMNAGAAIATGEILVFLHGDTRLPCGYDQAIYKCLAQAGVVAGAFHLKIDEARWPLRLVEWGVRWRSRLWQLPYGDQAIFMSTHVFQQLGGFPELPIMEDFVLIQRAKQLGRVAIAPAAVLTSNRRWQRLGVLQTTCINQLMLLGYHSGIAPGQLAQWYRRWK